MDHYNEWILYNSARALPTPVVLSLAYCPISSYLWSGLNLFLVSNSYLSPVSVPLLVSTPGTLTADQPEPWSWLWPVTECWEPSYNQTSGGVKRQEER